MEKQIDLNPNRLQHIDKLVQIHTGKNSTALYFTTDEAKLVNITLTNEECQQMVDLLSSNLSQNKKDLTNTILTFNKL